VDLSSRPPRLDLLGVEVAKARLSKGWSIDRLAEQSGVGRRTVINIEGAIKTPRLDTLFAVATALEVPLGDLAAVL
jgi:transcriptional regulator with XRE-family HTH domain